MKLRSGDIVVVRSFPEIASTLDDFGFLDGLPFLPEMLKYCGQAFPVWRPVNKLIQEGVGSTMRRIKDVVILEGPTCDGMSHGDCQRSCFPLWKTAWLRHEDEGLEFPSNGNLEAGKVGSQEMRASLPAGRTCQVTELMRATAPLPLWDPRRYYWDITAHTYTIGEYLSYIFSGLYRRTFKKVIVKVSREKPVVKPSIPNEHRDLQTGELVEVKSADEIRATLDERRMTRGLHFMPGMYEYCGRKMRVLHPIERMMSERTGEIRRLDRTVILEDAICTGKAHGGCQRICHVFWKDAWLRRIGPKEQPENIGRP